MPQHRLVPHGRMHGGLWLAACLSLMWNCLHDNEPRSGSLFHCVTELPACRPAPSTGQGVLQAAAEATAAAQACSAQLSAAST